MSVRPVRKLMSFFFPAFHNVDSQKKKKKKKKTGPKRNRQKRTNSQKSLGKKS